MTQYHIAANGEAAICRAKPGNCPLGGKHFNTKDAAEFYQETMVSQMIADEILPARTVLPAPPADLFIGVSNDELTARQRALTQLDISQTYGEPQHVEAALSKLREMGYNSFDPTWEDSYVQSEFLRRNVVMTDFPEITREKSAEVFAAVEDDDLRARMKALTKYEMAEQLGEPEDLRIAAEELQAAGYDIFDPTWELQYTQGEFLRRFHPKA